MVLHSNITQLETDGPQLACLPRKAGHVSGWNPLAVGACSFLLSSGCVPLIDSSLSQALDQGLVVPNSSIWATSEHIFICPSTETHYKAPSIGSPEPVRHHKWHSGISPRWSGLNTSRLFQVIISVCRMSGSLLIASSYPVVQYLSLGPLVDTQRSD